MCSLGCPNIEDQRHIFEQCSFLNTVEEKISLDHIFEDIAKQKEAIVKIFRIENEQLKLKELGESQSKGHEPEPDL